MAYGHARLSLLTKFSITFCAAASAALILLDALLELCLLGRANHHHHTGAHHSQEHRHQDRSGALAADKAATTPWAVVGASVATAALVLLQTGSETEQRKQQVTVRVALLLLCAWLGAGMTETHQELHGNVGLASRVADRSSTDPLPPLRLRFSACCFSCYFVNLTRVRLQPSLSSHSAEAMCKAVYPLDFCCKLRHHNRCCPISMLEWSACEPRMAWSAYATFDYGQWTSFIARVALWCWQHRARICSK